MLSNLLVEEYRGSIVENVHRGFICGVSDKGKVVFSVGDPNHIAYMRSTAKPIQAIPVFKLGLVEKYGLEGKEAAILCASHMAEPFHIEVLESIIAKTGIEEDKLICVAKPRRIYHNCAGKHFGILMLCKELGYDMESYWSIQNPVQQIIKKHISMISEYPEDDIRIGVDGCGVPVFAMPIRHIANAYLRLACPDLIGDSGVRSTVERIVKLMNAHPEMIAGTKSVCSALLQDDNIVAKGGAMGVYCFGLKKERLGFVLKIEDGSTDEWTLIIGSILEQIGYKNKTTLERLKTLFPNEIKNDNGYIVGSKKACFVL
ncbi:MAG: asparaginase [Clostridiales bacterium]|nr:asparaginase [Clostridiales bacterium]